MTRLSVNLNKVALIRNARGGQYPKLLQVAKDCEAFGAEGITVHPRPDERHIRYDDIEPLKEAVTTEFNIEGNPTERFLELVCTYPPHQCTLVPDAPNALTSDAGWDTIKHYDFLKDVCQRLQEHGVRVSIFLGTDVRLIEAAKKLGADRIELYTGPYADNYSANPSRAIASYIKAAEAAAEVNIGLNAGHDLNLNNLTYFCQNISNLLEVSIGHALVCDALYYGFQNTIKQYKHCIERARMPKH